MFPLEIQMITATEFTPISGLAGGLLIGLSATLLLWANGRIAGISGILGGLITPSRGDTGWRLAFMIGLLAGGVVYSLATGGMDVDIQVSWPWMLVGGFIVGFGTRLGSGCTSGHGVCGVGRMSQRSIVAMCTFMLTAGLTVFAVRHGFGG
jgi:uncharacterized membrane protein YedE/YeeE